MTSLQICARFVLSNTVGQVCSFDGGVPCEIGVQQYFVLLHRLNNTAGGAHEERIAIV